MFVSAEILYGQPTINLKWTTTYEDAMLMATKSQNIDVPLHYSALTSVLRCNVSNLAMFQYGGRQRIIIKQWCWLIFYYMLTYA